MWGIMIQVIWGRKWENRTLIREGEEDKCGRRREEGKIKIRMSGKVIRSYIICLKMFYSTCMCLYKYTYTV